jgi:hypothetical protein
MMRKAKGLLIMFVWLACGYVGAAMWAGDFYGQYGADGTETKGTASRSACLFLPAGPIYVVVMWSLARHSPMWDWPRHIFEYGNEPR